MRHRDVLGPIGEPTPQCEGRMVPAGDDRPLMLCTRCLVAARVHTQFGLPVATSWKRPGWHPKIRKGRRGQ